GPMADFPAVKALAGTLPCCGINTPYLIAIAPGAGPSLSVSPLVAPQVTVRNVSSSPLTFNNISASADFDVGGDCGTLLPPGGDCVLYLRSTNTAASGTVTIDSNATATPATFTITKAKAIESGTSPVLLYSQRFLSFPPALIGQGKTRSIRIRNVGTATGPVLISVNG